MKRLNLRKFSAAALALGFCAASLAGSVAPASASAEEVEFRKVDTSTFPTVKFTILPPLNSSPGEPLKLSENGVPVTNLRVESLAEANEAVGVVILMDTSDSTKERGILEAEKEAARAMISAKKPNERYGLVAYNGSARPVVNLTNDTNSLLQAVDNMKPAGEPALFDGIKLAGRLLQTESELQANIVVLSAAPEKSSSSSQEEAFAALNSAKAALFGIGITTLHPDVSNDAVAAMANATGGQYFKTEDNTRTTPLLADVQRNLQSQSMVTFTSTQKKSLTLNVAVGKFTGGAEASPNTVSLGSDIAPPAPQVKPPSFLSGNIGLLVIGFAVLGAVGLLGYGLVEIVGTDKNHLSRALRPYLDGNHEEEERDFSKLADSEIIKKAVASTAKMAQERGLLQFTQARLEQADLPLRPAEALFFTGVLSVVAMIIGLVVGKLIGLVIAGMVFLYLPFAVTGFLAKRRKKKFTGQLPDTLQLLAGSMRAGYSLVQGLDAVSKQAEAPMGTELQRAMAEARLGRPIDEALQDVSDRMGSDDFEWAVMAIKIQRDVGGNLAELLMTVSETMIARERLRREVAGLTAEGRMSAIILVGLPPGVGLLVMLFNPAYMQPMIGNFLGQMALVGAAVLMGIGWFVMQKLMEIEA